LRGALAWLALPGGVVLGLAGGLLALGHPDHALGLALGYGLGACLALSWVVGAVRRFDAPLEQLARFTLGMWPLRLVLLVGGGALGIRLGAHVVTLVMTLFVAHAYGHVLEARAFQALAAGTRPESIER
jgi:hypothetical protein